MFNIKRTRQTTAVPVSSVVSTQQTARDNPSVQTSQQRSRRWWWRWWQIIKHSPIPFGTMVLLAGGLLLWLAGHADLTHWLLLVAVVLGGLPLIWNTMQQFLRQEFSVDVIALLAITGSLLLGQYLAGALIVLMLSGGEALEAYALRRARSSLSALAECAPIGANLEGHEG